MRLDAAPPIGQVFPQAKLDDGRRLDDVIERRFAMLADAAFLASMPHELRATLRAAGIKVVAAPSSGVDAWLATNKVRSVLIRPDAYVHATANSHDDLSIAVVSLARAFGTAALANIGRR